MVGAAINATDIGGGFANKTAADCLLQTWPHPRKILRIIVLNKAVSLYLQGSHFAQHALQCSIQNAVLSVVPRKRHECVANSFASFCTLLAQSRHSVNFSRTRKAKIDINYRTTATHTPQRYLIQGRQSRYPRGPQMV